MKRFWINLKYEYEDKCTLEELTKAQLRNKGIAATSALDRRWVIKVAFPSLYTRERDPLFFTGRWIGPRAGLDGCGKPRCVIRWPDGLSSSELLYRLQYNSSGYLCTYVHNALRCVAFLFVALCCVVLCCVVLCCVVLCCVVLCCVVLCCVGLCCVVLCWIVLWWVVMCFVVLWWVVMCFVVLWWVVFGCVVLCCDGLCCVYCFVMGCVGLCCVVLCDCA